MATHSSILAWRISWTEDLGRLQSTGKQRKRLRDFDFAWMLHSQKKKKKLPFILLFHSLWRPCIDTQIKSGQIFYSYSNTFSSMSDFLLVNFFNHLRTNIDTLLSQLIALRLIIINNKAQYYFSDEKASFYSYTEVLLAWSIKTENPRKGNTLNSMQIFQIFFFFKLPIPIFG